MVVGWVEGKKVKFSFCRNPLPREAHRRASTTENIMFESGCPDAAISIRYTLLLNTAYHPEDWAPTGRDLVGLVVVDYKKFTNIMIFQDIIWLENANIEEIERAKAIVCCFEEEVAKGNTGFVHEQYGFIDEPIYRGALAVLGK